MASAVPLADVWATAVVTSEPGSGEGEYVNQSPSEENVSLWMATAELPAGTALQEDRTADVCIIGAGIAGLTTAYLLARQGTSVVVLDDGPIAGGQTQRTTAHLSNAIDDRYVEIERLHGPEGARLAAQSHTAAIDCIASIIRDERIACDFIRLDGYLFLAPGASAEQLDRELAAARQAGLAAVERLARAPLSAFDTGPCLRFPGQGQFHALKYLAGMALAIERLGGHVFTGAHVVSVEGGTPAQVKTSDGRLVTAEAVVVATNSPVIDRVAIHTKQAPYMTYVVGLFVPRGAVTTALYWDTLDPYHYVRLQR
jgi:glycine/D-amino acid oxidase-like deaminating enzyme